MEMELYHLIENIQGGGGERGEKLCERDVQ